MFKIFVGNLDGKVTNEMLTPMFAAFGELDEVIVARDEDGNSRGFAIVLFKDAMKGQLAVETFQERKILGRTIVINEAMKKGKKKMAPVDLPAPRGPFGPKFGGGGGVGPRSGIGSRPPAGFSRGASSRGASAGSAGGAGADRRASSSRNPRRSGGTGGAIPRPSASGTGGVPPRPAAVPKPAPHTPPVINPKTPPAEED